VRSYTTLATPLTRLAGAVPWPWGEMEERALTNAPVLVLPDPNKPYRVVCNASDVGVGAVLLQDEKPVAYFSKKFNPAKRNYSTTEKELLGVLCALKDWRCYLLGKSFSMCTDHKATSFLQNQPLLSPRWVG
jgi:RNase H-like domain found in reverse transcriptase